MVETLYKQWYGRPIYGVNSTTAIMLPLKYHSGHLFDSPYCGASYPPLLQPPGSAKRCETYTGSMSRATHPEAPARFESVSAPPCASAIWRLSASPMPDPPGLVVKNGTNRFVVPASPGPSSSMRTSTLLPFLRQPMVTPPPVSSAAPAALRNRLISS